MHKKKESKEIKTTPAKVKITISHVEEWFPRKGDGLSAYRKWLSQSSDPYPTLQLLRETLEQMEKNWSSWMTYFSFVKMQAFIAQTIAIYHQSLSSAAPKEIEQTHQEIQRFLIALPKLLKNYSTKMRPDIVENIPCNIGQLLQSGFNLLNQPQNTSSLFNPDHVFHALEILRISGLLSFSDLAESTRAIGFLAKNNLFLESTIDMESGRWCSFHNSWDHWQESTEKQIAKDSKKIKSQAANALMQGLAMLAEMEKFNKKPLQMKTVAILLNSVNNEPINVDPIFFILRNLRILVDTVSIDNLAKLNMKPLMQMVLSFLGDDGSYDFSKKHAQQANILTQVAHIYCKVKVMNDASKLIDFSALVEAIGRTDPDPKNIQQCSSAIIILLSISQILQVVESDDFNSHFRKYAENIISKLSSKEIVEKMQISDIAHALYALVLPKKRAWLDIKPTNCLVDEFLLKFNVELSKSEPLVKKIVSAAQQVAEYLCLTHQELPEELHKFLDSRKPTIAEDQPQHQLFNLLPKLSWFNEKYYDCKEEVRLGKKHSHFDIVFKDRKSKKTSVIEVDGSTHEKRQPQDTRRDEYYLEQKLAERIVHTPVYYGITVEEMAEDVRQKLVKHDLSPISDDFLVSKSAPEEKKRIKKYTEEAAEQLEQLAILAKNGDSQAQLMFAKLKFINYTTNQVIDKEQFLYWVNRSIEGNNVNAIIDLALFHIIETKNYNEALRLLKSAEQQSSGVKKGMVQFYLGYCFELGKGVTKDLNKAIRYYQLAEKVKYVEAQLRLGLCYLNGMGVEKDEEMAFDRFRRAALQGSKEAIFYVALCMINGKGVSVKKESGLMLMHKAAEYEVLAAQAFLGAYYIDKKGKKDTQLGEMWLEKAAKAGSAEAQWSLSLHYSDKNDQSNTLKWVQIAADNGHVEAQFALFNCQAYNAGPQTLWKMIKFLQNPLEQNFRLAVDFMREEKTMSRLLRDAATWAQYDRPNNYDKAKTLYTLVANYGCGENARRARKLSKEFDEFEQKMKISEASAYAKQGFLKTPTSELEAPTGTSILPTIQLPKEKKAL